MRAVLLQCSLEFDEELLGRLGRMPAAPQECDNLFLAGNVAFALGDVVVHHSKIGGTKGHDPFYHCLGGESRHPASGSEGALEISRCMRRKYDEGVRWVPEDEA